MDHPDEEHSNKKANKYIDDETSFEKEGKIKSSMKRNINRDRRRSIQYKKKKKKKSNIGIKKDKILESHIPYDGDATKSPHIPINK